MATRDNLGRIRRHAAVVIDKELEKKAKKADINLKREVRNKLEETYKNNVYLDYAAGYMTGGRRFKSVLPSYR